MTDNTVQIAFGGDASGVTSAADAAKSAVTSIFASVKDLGSSLADMGEKATAAFAALKAGGAEQASAALGNLVGPAQGVADALVTVGKAASEADLTGYFAQLGQVYSQDVASYAAALAQKSQANASYSAAATATTVKAVGDQTSAVTAGLNRQDAARSADLVKFKREWNGVVDPIVSSFGRGLVQMMEGTKSFSQVMRSVGQTILEDMMKVVDRLVENWLWGVTERALASTQGQGLLDAIGMKSVAQSVLQEQAKTSAAVAGASVRTAATATGATAGAAAEAASATASIGTSAAKSAAAVYGDITASFGPAGPFVAPAFAAAALAAVLDYRGLVASAAGGFDIPSGFNPLTQLHAEEMVLPATLANPLRSALAGYSAANLNAPIAANANGGDTHNHYYSINAMDGPSFRGFLRGNSDHLSTVLQEMGRRGQKTG